jgi:hypothetical protein
MIPLTILAIFIIITTSLALAVYDLSFKPVVVTRYSPKKDTRVKTSVKEEPCDSSLEDCRSFTTRPSLKKA